MDIDTILLRQLRRFLYQPAFIKALANGQMNEVMGMVNHAEWVIQQEFRGHPQLRNNLDRPALLSRLLFKDIRKLEGDELAARIANVQTFLDNIIFGREVINAGGRRAKIGGIDYIMLLDPDLNYQFWRNFSTAMTGTYYKAKPHLANNHAIIEGLRDPRPFLDPLTDRLRAMGVPEVSSRVLEFNAESASRMHGKVDDVNVAFEVPQLIVDTAAGRMELTRRFFRMTGDVKFYASTSGIGSYKNVYQQIMHTFQDRVMDEYAPLIGEILTKGLSADEEARLAAEFLPVIFHHVVIKPKDTSPLSEAMRGRYAEQFVRFGKVHFESGLGTVLGQRFSDHPKLHEAILGNSGAVETHAQELFASGKFMSDHTRLLHGDGAG